MAWLLQTPDPESPKLIAYIARGCKSASGGGAAFAFASGMGVKLLTADPNFQEFLKTSKFLVVIGLDAITDTRALDSLRRVRSSYPNFKPMLFLHDIPATCFHPKTMWLRIPSGGLTITGSGNLTPGGLGANWEALCVERLNATEIDAVEACWDRWLSDYKKHLLDLDDPLAIERAKSNERQRARVARVLKVPEAQDAVIDTELEDIDGITTLAPVLIAEVPKSDTRWQQINSDVKTYQQFFGVTLGKPKTVRLYNVRSDGSLGPGEDRPAVAVKSHNYRFEIGAARGRNYPVIGHPIAIFEKISNFTFNYILLMPGEPEHTLIQRYIDENYVATRGKKRITITAGELRSVWPASPLF